MPKKINSAHPHFYFSKCRYNFWSEYSQGGHQCELIQSQQGKLTFYLGFVFYLLGLLKTKQNWKQSADTHFSVWSLPASGIRNVMYAWYPFDWYLSKKGQCCKLKDWVTLEEVEAPGQAWGEETETP